jgi:hypothetical protein
LSRASGTQKAVVADFGGALGQDVLKKSVDKLGGGKPDVADLPGFVVTVVESNDAIVEGLQAAIGNGDSENITGEIVEHGVAPAGVLGVNDPARFPDGGRNESKQSSLFESGTEFGAEDDGKSGIGDQEQRMFGIHPRPAIVRETSGGDEHVDVRMKQHGARPGVKDCQNAKTSAQIPRIGRQLLQSIGGGLHQQAVDFLGMGASEWAQTGGQRESHQKVGAAWEAGALFVDPALSLRLVTLRAGAVAAGVVGKDFLLAMIALVDMASQQRRPAGGDIPQSPFLR